jgi:hypothetical protein
MEKAGQALACLSVCSASGPQHKVRIGKCWQTLQRGLGLSFWEGMVLGLKTTVYSEVRLLTVDNVANLKVGGS